jgi:RNA polymerase sigma-70 factor (ECF subfamily)
MPEPEISTIQLHHWLERMRAGDAAARNELLQSLCSRLERLARKMLRRFPSVQRWEQSDDVLQNALLRLFRALEHVQPASVDAFFGLAAEQMRRELLDLARHYLGPHGMGAHHSSHPDALPSMSPSEAMAPADQPEDLERWFHFHEEVERLPAEEREVVGLVFYHGWTQSQVAELFQVDVRTIRRRWQAALLRLRDHLQESPPTPRPSPSDNSTMQ